MFGSNIESCKRCGRGSYPKSFTLRGQDAKQLTPLTQEPLIPNPRNLELRHFAGAASVTNPSAFITASCTSGRTSAIL